MVWVQVLTVFSYSLQLIEVSSTECAQTMRVRCYSVKITLQQLSTFGSWRMWATSLLHVQRMVRLDYGTATITVLLQGALHQLQHKAQLQEVSSHYAPFLQKKLSLVDGQMVEFVLSELTIASCFGRLTMHTKVEWLLFVLLVVASLFAQEAWKVTFAFGKSDPESSFRIWKNTAHESLRSNYSLMTLTFCLVLAISQS